MIGSTDPESSVGYLTLGVFAQSIAERLIEAEGGDASSSQQVLKEAIEALNAVKEHRYEEVETAGLRPFPDYDQVSALYEVLSRASQGIEDVLALLTEMKNSPAAIENTTRERAVRFFDDLASEALQLSRRPPEGIPSGIRGM